jgi:hypothetical protein
MKLFQISFGYEKVDNCYLSDFCHFVAGLLYAISFLSWTYFRSDTVQDKRIRSIRAASSLKKFNLKINLHFLTQLVH